MLGFSEKTDKNPSRQARVIVALTSPRTCDVVIKLPDVIMKYFYHSSIFFLVENYDCLITVGQF